MKSFINKVLVCVIGIIASVTVAQPVQAQSASSMSPLKELSFPVGEFNGLQVGGDFEVNVSRGSNTVRVTVDEPLSKYVDVYVRSKTLFIVYNEKSVPKELRKQYKGRGATKPVFRAYVSMPMLNFVSLSDNAVLNCADEFSGSSFELEMTDKAQVKNLATAGSNLKVNLKKNAQASLSFRSTDLLEVVADGNSNLKLFARSRSLVFTATGSSQAALDSESDFLTLSTAGSGRLTANSHAQTTTLLLVGSSALTLSGDSPECELKAERNATLDADSFFVRDLKAEMSGSPKATVSVSDSIDVSLMGGSLFYVGQPIFKIGKIVKSTLAPKGTATK